MNAISIRQAVALSFLTLAQISVSADLVPIVNRFASETDDRVIKVSRDGMWVAAVEKPLFSSSQYVHIFDSVTRELKWVSQSHSSIAFTPDSQSFFQNGVFYDVNTFQPISEWMVDINKSQDFDFDLSGRYLVCGSLVVYDVAKRELFERFSMYNSTAYSKPMVDRNTTFALFQSSSDSTYQYKGFGQPNLADTYPKVVPQLNGNICVPNELNNSIIQGRSWIRKHTYPGFGIAWQSASGPFTSYGYTQNFSKVVALNTANVFWLNEANGATLATTPYTFTTSQFEIKENPLANSTIIGTRRMIQFSNSTHQPNGEFFPHSGYNNKRIEINPTTRLSYESISQGYLREVSFDQRAVLRQLSVPNPDNHSVTDVCLLNNQYLFVFYRQLTPSVHKLGRINLSNLTTQFIEVPFWTDKVQCNFNGSKVVVVGDGNYLVVNPESMAIEGTFPTLDPVQQVYDVQISPDGSKLLLVLLGNATLYDLQSGTQLWNYPSSGVSFDNGVFSADGSMIFLTRSETLAVPVTVLHSSNGSLAGSIHTGESYGQLFRLSNGDIWIGQARLYRLDPSTFTVNKTYEYGPEIAWSLRFLPTTGSRALIRCHTGIFEVDLGAQLRKSGIGYSP